MKAKFKPVLFTAALASLLTACQRSAPPPAMPAPAVTVNQPVQRDVVEWDNYPGWLEAVDSVEVRARVSGYLKSIHFKDGADVKKGDLLFIIDQRPYQAEVDRMEAEVNQAQSRLELARSELARAERLLQSKTISEEEADTRRKSEREMEAGIQSARASLETARINLDYTRITAPIDGRIGRRLVTEGNLVNGNQGQVTLLTTIVSLDPIYARFDADEHAVLKYQQLAREGKGGNIREGKVICELGLDNETGFPHKGLLDFVDNRLDTGTGTLRVRAVFANEDRALQPGFFARVRVPGAAKYPALMIPDQAVGTDQEQKFVWTVSAQDTLEYRIVKLGPLIDGLRVVRSGLKPEDWVVVNGLMSTRGPGMKVRAGREKQASAPAAAAAQVTR